MLFATAAAESLIFHPKSCLSPVPGNLPEPIEKHGSGARREAERKRKWKSGSPRAQPLKHLLKPGEYHGFCGGGKLSFPSEVAICESKPRRPETYLKPMEKHGSGARRAAGRKRKWISGPPRARALKHLLKPIEYHGFCFGGKLNFPSEVALKPGAREPARTNRKA